MLTDSITGYTAKEMQPFNTVQKPAFKEVLQTFDRPKKTYISQTAVPASYNKVKDAILKEIKDVCFYSATTDMWSSSNMTPYVHELDHTLHNF